jgi:opacity protein-like surface antigen
MAGTGDFFSDKYAHLQQTQMPHYYGGAQSDCYSTYAAAPVYQPAPAYQPIPNYQPATAYQPIPAYQPAPQTPCAAQAAIPSNPYASAPSAQGQFGLQPQTAYAPHGQPYYGAAQYGPAQHGQSGAYYQGTPQAQTIPYGQGAYVPPSHAVNSYGLRGGSLGFRPHAYGTLGAVSYEVGEELFGAQARLGYQFNKYLGVEAEGSLGLSDATTDEIFGDIPVEQSLEVNNSAAVFGVLRYPLIDKLNGYGRLGYHNTGLDQTLTVGTADPVDSEFSVDGIAYGAGLEYALSPRTSLRLDYTVYDYDGPDADSVSLAIARKF